MKSFVLYVALAVLFIDFINAKSLKTKIIRERRNSPTIYQQSNGNSIAGLGQQTRCPEMCVRWNTVLKENGQLENTPIVTSPVVPGDKITQCPKQCDLKCCSTASQSFAQSDQSQTSDGGLQDDQGHPPACMEGCPKACYPACRTACCNAPRMMSMYQQSMSPMMQPQPFAQQATGENQQPIDNPFSYPMQNMNEPTQRREMIPYASPQVTPAIYPSAQYSYSQPEMTSQTRATIPKPGTSFVQSWQPTQQRSNIPKHTASAHASTCPVPCSPICAPHCTKHCCESYD